MAQQQQDLTDVERDRRALEIFVQACGLSAQERAALLEHLCGGDTVVRGRVEAMLAADVADETPVGSDADVDRFVARQINEITPGGSGAGDASAGAGGPLFPADDAVGGEYTILRVIGEGGMGTVYEAEQHHPRRRVAIKAIRPGRITPAMSKRFEYEAQVLARLEHPGIARLYESNTQSEGGRVRAYLAMELVEGVPIDTYCVANGVPVVERLRLFMRVCDAVAYAHRIGVIHRDLKPANILVTADGQPKVLDFGVARTIGRGGGSDDVTHLTQHGQIVGTLGYMSPEQVEGRADVDTRADVYSLGVILYKLLTGLLPIDVGNDSLVDATRRILTEAPIRIGHHDRRFKGDLEVVVCRALEKEPGRRYASVDQLRAELDRHLSGRPIEARADSALYVFRKAVWRHRMPVTIGVVLLGMLASFGVLATIQANRNRRLAEDAEVARSAAVGAEARATDRAEQFRRLLYFSNIGFAQSALENNDMERAYTLLDGCDPALREWEWAYLQRLRDLSSGTARLGIGRPRYASFTKDHNRVAIASLDREVALLDVTDGGGGPREVLRERLSDGTARAALSPDGRWLAYGGTVNEVVLHEVATGTKRKLAVEREVDPRSRGLRMLRFTDDSATLVTGGLDRALRVWDVATATLLTTIRIGEPQPVCLQLAHDGTWAAVGDNKGGLRLFDLRMPGPPVRELVGHDAPVWSLALSEDGKRLASGDNDGRVCVWDPATGERVMQFDRNDGWYTALCFSPDGSRLALGRSDSTVRLLDLRDGTVSGTLRGHRHAIVHVEWQADDTLHTVSIDGTLRTWTADAALQVPTIVTGQSETIGLAFDRAGDSVFAGGVDGSVRRWAVAEGQAQRPAEVRRLGEHTAAVLEIAVDPASGRVCTAGRDGVLRISHPDREGEPPLLIAPGTGVVSAVDFSPDGSRLILGTDKELSMWDAHAGTKIRDFAPSGIVANELRFDRQGATFYAACTDGHVRRWDAGSPSPIADVMVDSHGLYDVQVSPDGRTLAVAGDTQSVTLLDAQTLATVKRYVGHQGGVLAVAFHPGGRRLASGGSDGSIRVWDVDTATELVSLRGHRRRIQHVAFGPKGDTLASSSDDGTLKLWRTTTPPAAALPRPATTTPTLPR